jgi:hypothetical protein
VTSVREKKVLFEKQRGRFFEEIESFLKGTAHAAR